MSELNMGPAPVQPEAVNPTRPHKKFRGRLAFMVYGVLIGMTLAGLANTSDDTTNTASQAPAPAPTVTVTAAAKAAPAVTVTAKPAAKPVVKPKPVAKPVVKPKPAPVSDGYKAITPRQWLLIAKDPDSHIGESIVVYGVITQFDSSTGTDNFRANVDGIHHVDDYEYDENTVLSGDESDFADLVQDDEFKAKVTVIGSLSYDTQIGGSTKVPQLTVDSISLIK